MATNNYTKFAFISYSHRDMAVAEWLQKHLEAFKLPTGIHNGIEAKSRYLRPIFRDQSDLNTGILGDELRKHLEESKFLILLCSKDSAHSIWVSDEAKVFTEMGRLDHIIPVIIPNGDTFERELFPEYLREYFKKNPDKELLGINIGEVGKEKALIRVVSKMLSVSFDSLWKRHQRQKRIRILTTSLSTMIAVGVIYVFALPVSVSIHVNMDKADLPVGENVTLNANGGEYFSNPNKPQFERITIPGYRRFSALQVSVTSQFHIPVDTSISVGFGLNRDVNIELKRDDTFAIYAGTVYDSEMNPLQDVIVAICGHTSVTDSEGNFSIILPLSEQRQELPISIEKNGYLSILREDEPPGQSLKFIMHH
ncbi:MAG: toll/interleukin-1 receptor domain-containing protein [Prevotella sp.]|nr:toll/interleukin-1 receptor domain-containing protein [Prevotella sp.]